jgi:SAM-dependent methyltransferase
MSLYKSVGRKTNADLALQWDVLAPMRDHQIRSGSDVSFHRVLVPEILKLAGPKRYRRVLDLGCGTGVMTSMVQHISENLDGIDISSVSIDLAKNSNTSSRMNFINTSVEEYSEAVSSKYDLVISNMVLMDVMNLRGVLSSVEKILRPGGIFIFSMTNPLFWASYYGYSQEDWYKYNEEIFVEGPFLISEDYGKSNRSIHLKSTHVHRPISMYVNGLTSANFSKIILREPMPESDIEALYPKKWDFPRYIIGKCIAGPKIRWI